MTFISLCHAACSLSMCQSTAETIQTIQRTVLPLFSWHNIVRYAPKCPHYICLFITSYLHSYYRAYLNITVVSSSRIVSTY